MTSQNNSSPQVVNMRNCIPMWGQPGDIRIDRHTKWGNPFVMEKEMDRDTVCNRYIGWFAMQVHNGKLNIAEIADAKRLGCWCKPKRCHGDHLKQKIEEYNATH